MSDRLIITHCSPTLAGLKTGSLCSCRCESDEQLRGFVRALNRRLRSRGVRALALRRKSGRALLYLYRPPALQRDMDDPVARALLCEYGYPCESPERCIVQLIQRLRRCDEFPHEIGLFLGYPPEDVRGFIQNGAAGAKLTGYWKVYGDEQRASKIFMQYRRCTERYTREYQQGVSIERLTAAI